MRVTILGDQWRILTKGTTSYSLTKYNNQINIIKTGALKMWEWKMQEWKMNLQYV